MRTFARASFHSIIAILAVLSICAVMLGGCATASTAKPDVTVASYGTTILSATADLQKMITDLTRSRLLPVVTGQKLTGYVEQVYQKSGELATALRAYHAATTPVEQQSKAALVQTLLTQLSGPLAQMLSVDLPEGTVQRLTKLIGTVMSVVGAIQSEVAKGLGGDDLIAMDDPPFGHVFVRVDRSVATFAPAH